LSDFNEIEFSREIKKNTPIVNYIKVRPLGAELFHAHRRADGRPDMTKLIVAFRKFATACKMICSCNLSLFNVAVPIIMLDEMRDRLYEELNIIGG
jgi:hypothetical protein